MKRILIASLHIYQRISAVLIANRIGLWKYVGCRSWPTCSEYTIAAIEREGVIRGGYRGFLRVLRCNPFFAPQTSIQ